MKTKTDKTELAALKKICGHLETVAEKYAAKHAEIVNANMALLQSGDYTTEQDIMEAYGWNAITEEEKDTLLAALESGKEAANVDTVWSVAARILRKDVSGYKAEISEIEYQLMSPAEKKKYDEANAKFQAEQEERRKRLGKERGGERE